MISEPPSPFKIRVFGSKGDYELAFTPNNDKGIIETLISDRPMVWHVETIEIDVEGNLVLAGLTRGTEAIWDDSFWFILTTGKAGSKIDYWGTQVLFRTDYASDRA